MRATGDDFCKIAKKKTQQKPNVTTKTLTYLNIFVVRLNLPFELCGILLCVCVVCGVF